MKAKEVVLTIVIALLFCFQIIFPIATAHTGGIFTIIVSENGVVPGNVQMLVNDTARWINVDDRENITHRILVDSDSDGIYDGENDWENMLDETPPSSPLSKPSGKKNIDGL